jgi:cysteine desulfurase family protein (TIGR01976 family)
VSAPELDVAAVRARFPALADGVAHLDGPGGSQVPGEVVDAVTACLVAANANLGGAFATSHAADEIVDAGHRAAADLVGGRAEEIAFGPSMSALNYLLVHAVMRTLEPGDRVLVTTLDHDANVSPWLTVAPERGVEVERVGVTPGDLAIDLDDLEAKLSPRTRVVAFTLASNACGTVPDTARIVDLAHAAGALAWADAVHAAPHRRLAAAALGLDVLLCSPYKFFGPHLGIAWAREELLESWPADRVRPSAEHPPGHRFELGTLSHEAIAGTTAAIDYLASLGQGDGRPERLDDAFARIRAYEEALSRRWLEGAGSIRGARGLGIADPERAAERTPTFSLTVDGWSPRALAAALGERGIQAWDGNYYALELMRHLGLEEGALRVGFLHYTTAGEVDRALAALDALAA